MTAPPRKKKKPGDGDGGVRVERASDKPNAARIAAGQDPQWLNPREPLPAGVTSDPAKPKLTIMDRAIAVFPDPKLMDMQLLAAVIVAQALDRLGEKIIDAGAVASYKRGP